MTARAPLAPALALALALLPAAATAQQDERLPDLTPQEFEIRGELQVSLPDLQRQPLRGFAPPPRTFVVPADRRAFVAPYGQDPDALPAYAIPTPPPPSIVRAQPRSGQVDLLAGRYLARRGRLTLNTRTVGLDVRYTGFSDFTASPDAAPATPGEPPTATLGADDLTARLTFTGGDAVRFQWGLDGELHRYDLLSAYFRENGQADPTRNLRALGTTLELEGVGTATVPFRAAVRLEHATLRDGLNNDGAPVVDPIFETPTLEQRELRVAAEGAATLGALAFDAAGALARLGEDALFSSYASAAAGGHLALPLGPARLELGARALAFATSEANGDARGVQLGPVVDLDAPIARGFRFFAFNRPAVHDRSVASLARTNPYAAADALVLPDVLVLDAEAGVEVQLGTVRLRAFGGYRYAPTHLYFTREMASLPPWDGAPGLYRARYDRVAMPRGGADLTVHAPGGVSLAASAEVRQPRLPGADRAVPFLAPVVGRASVAVPFADARGLVQATLEAEGPRPTLLGADAPAWADASVEAHYRFAGRFGALVRADHLAGRAERWPGFPRPPLTITAGVRAGW